MSEEHTGDAAFLMANQWYKDHGETLMPTTPEFSTLYSDAELEINLGSQGAGYPMDMDLPGKGVALLSACIAGLSPAFLEKVAKHHGAADSLYLLVEGFGECNFKDSLASGEKVNAYEVLKPCLAAIESVDENAFSRAYNLADHLDSTVTLAMTHANSPRQWPSAHLERHQKAFDGAQNPIDKPLIAAIHDSLNLNRVRGMPSDQSGFRCDWLLERTGMLLPGVIRKNLGRFTLWEEFFGIVANYYDAKEIQRLFEDCVNAPLAIRPAIYNGFQSMMAEGPKVVLNSPTVREAIQRNFTNTWLAPLQDSIVLQINMIGTRFTKAAETIKNSHHYPAVFRQPEKIITHLYDEIGQVSPNEIGLAQFAALSFPQRQDLRIPKQFIDPAIDREGFITHLLEALDSFRGDPTQHTKEQRAIQDNATEGVTSVINTLAPLGAFDYSRFKDISSSSARFLAMAGLDTKRLPAMNRRDKGQLLEESLGL
jgi:hypothetical protein